MTDQWGKTTKEADRLTEEASRYLVPIILISSVLSFVMMLAGWILFNQTGEI